MENEINVPDLNINLRVNLFVVICEAPMTVKAFNINQYNGEFGCFSCCHPGDSSETSSRIYPYSNNDGEINEYEPRSNQLYLNQVIKAIRTNSTYKGVKGPCYFSKYIPCPERRLIDYMHSCILGTSKYTVELLIDSTNSAQPFYLGNSQIGINNLLQNIQYLSDYPRLQRKFQVYKHYQANEIKSFIMNAAT